MPKRRQNFHTQECQSRAHRVSGLHSSPAVKNCPSPSPLQWGQRKPSTESGLSTPPGGDEATLPLPHGVSWNYMESGNKMLRILAPDQNRGSDFFFTPNHRQLQMLHLVVLSRESCPPHTRLGAQPEHCRLWRELEARPQARLAGLALMHICILESLLTGETWGYFSTPTPFPSLSPPTPGFINGSGLLFRAPAAVR